jgi:hypothetical protein
MPQSPPFTFYISPGRTPVSGNSALWRQPLPLSRHLTEKEPADSICSGDYFQALETFIESDGYDILCRALSASLQQEIKPDEIREIRITLEKHGEFYHPARMEALARHQKSSFVLNVAVSDTGLETIKNEFRLLNRLNDEYPLCFLPKIYGFGEVETTGKRKIRVVLGQWFEGYNEFHISRDPSDHTNKILVWDDLHGHNFLSPEQSADLYRQAAGILTYYYNIESFEQILSWHHAAGDFVVKINNGDLDLKLVTVRGYAPFFKNASHFKKGETDVELTLQALLIFFLNLSVRMRLDRLDGVGDIVWADRLAVKSTVEGFLEGLAQKPQIAFMPDTVDKCFRYYLSLCTREDLYDLSKAAANAFHRRAPEVQVIKRHLKEHVEELGRAIAHVL